MSVNNRYVPQSVKVDSTMLRLTTANLDPATVRRLYAPDGSIDPTASALIAQAPMFRFTTPEVAAALAIIGLNGLDVVTAIEFGWAARTQGGGVEAAVGKKVSAAKCYLVPESLSISQDGDAEISYLGYAYSSNGTTAPLAQADTLPTGTPSVAELFTLGTVTVGGVAIKEQYGYTMNFGYEVRRNKKDGHLYPTSTSIINRRPSIDVTLADMAEVSAARLLGGEVSTIVLNIIKRSLTGGGLAGSGDPTITFEKMFAVINAVGGSHTEDVEAVYHGDVRKGSGAIFVVA